MESPATEAPVGRPCLAFIIAGAITTVVGLVIVQQFADRDMGPPILTIRHA